MKPPATALVVSATLVMCLVLTGGCAASSRPARREARPLASQLSTASDYAPRVVSEPLHSVGWDALEDDNIPGVPLSEVLSELNWTPSLPDAALVGRPVKVLSGAMPDEDRATSGPLIKYESGVKLYIQPGETDFVAILETQARETSEVPWASMEEVAGRQTLVNPGVVTELGGDEFVVPKIVSWSLRGYTYSLRSSSASVTIEQLKNVAASLN